MKLCSESDRQELNWGLFYVRDEQAATILVARLRKVSPTNIDSTCMQQCYESMWQRVRVASRLSYPRQSSMKETQPGFDRCFRDEATEISRGIVTSKFLVLNVTKHRAVAAPGITSSTPCENLLYLHPSAYPGSTDVFVSTQQCDEMT